MQPIPQSDAINALAPEQGERTHFFAARRFDDIECLTATFVSHAYTPHSHETYAIGCIVSGCEQWSVGGVQHYGRAGDIVAINPGEVHDGAPFGDHFTYRMTYPTITLMSDIATSLSGRRSGVPRFHRAVEHDPDGSALFVAAHRAIEAGADCLLGEEMLLRALGRALVRFASIPGDDESRMAQGISLVRDLMDAEPCHDYALQGLARLAGVSPHHLIRAFRKAYGLTPHAYLVNRRIERAKQHLKRGEKPVDVASALGFSDQAHLTRAFKARLGTTPAAYRAAFQ